MRFASTYVLYLRAADVILACSRDGAKNWSSYLRRWSLKNRRQWKFFEPMLEDPKLLERLFHDQETFMRISPHLLFWVLLRRVRKELEKEAYVLEPDSKGKRIPVFEAPAVAEMLPHKRTRDYLAEMLSSFARTNSGVIYWKERGIWGAWRTIAGYEAIHMIRKGQACWSATGARGGLAIASFLACSAR